MANISNHNFNGFPIDGSMRSQTQYNLFAGYLSEGFSVAASRSIPGDVSIFGFFFAILNLVACISAGVLLLIWIILSWLFRLIFRSGNDNVSHHTETIGITTNDYTSEELDYYLSDKYAKLQDKKCNTE